MCVHFSARVKIIVQPQQASVEQLHLTAAALRQHMTQHHDHIAQAEMVVDGCDNLRNVAI